MTSTGPQIAFFGDGRAEGSATDKDLLGGKGANLAEMCRIGVPVPPGFTIATDVCNIYFQNKGKIPAMGREAADALEGPQGDTLRSAEADAADRSRDTP